MRAAIQQELAQDVRLRRTCLLAALGIATSSWYHRAVPARGPGRRGPRPRPMAEALWQAVRDAGELDLTVPPLPPNLGEDWLTADRQNWFNLCVARYYGVRSIATPS